MSRYCAEINTTPILEAAARWRERALLSDTAVFTDRPLWTLEGLQAMEHYFVQNPDEGEGKFWEKLRGQLEPTAAAVKQLAAEMTWLMLLCPSNVSAATKEQQISEVWHWSGEPLPESAAPWMNPEVLHGVGSAGPGYNNHRWRELVYCINFCLAFKQLPDAERRRVLGDGWAFAEWLETVPGTAVRQLRHMVLFLLFPDDFERIFGSLDRKAVAREFGNLSAKEINGMSPTELDRTLHGIRKALEEEYGTKELDYYEQPLYERWQKADLKAANEITREHVLEALTEIDREGVPADAASSTYDLIYGVRRYPPKLVLSLANKYTFGEELDRSAFSGGADTQAFKVLQKLGFHIERKNFVEELLQRFIAQADAATDLAVQGYPESYRGLAVRVSMGKGNFAKVPWISFLGFGQQTQKGIYPGFLYFKSKKVLLLTYGVSDTEKPPASWDVKGSTQTTDEYFQENFGQPADRYGTSFVYAAYPVPDAVDASVITKDLDALIDAYEKLFARHSPVGTVVSEPEPKPLVYDSQPYTVEQALDGLFIEPEKFKDLLSILKAKKNLILQGPPGVGKTFFAKRLGYALMAEKAPRRLEMVQFHPSYAYEDFIQGYRPSGTGFTLKNGVFYRFCKRAADDPTRAYVFVIDEINRGNLSKVFGELMMLMESDKRGSDWAMSLTYSDEADEKFYVPENLYLIGLMNTADRSLAMVDYALRRRFAFVDLKPGFEVPQFRQFLLGRGATASLVGRITQKMALINDKIASDKANLGPGYCIGHSYFSSIQPGMVLNEAWYRQVITSEIAPLLREYWFDDAAQAESLINDALVAG